MSSIFSDPPFRRGTTLAAGDFGDAATSGVNILGGELVGQIKAFQDVDPSTGQRYSNRLVYCQAVRWLGGAVADATTVAGAPYKVSATHENGKPFCSITEQAVNSDVPAHDVVILDEYLTGSLTNNDVVWAVVKGPTAVRSAGTAIANGAQVQLNVSSPTLVTGSTNQLGISIHGASAGGTAGARVRINMWSNRV